MKKIFMTTGIILLIIALPFISMVMETVTAQTKPVMDVREGDAMKKRGITQEQYAVAPVDIFESNHLKEVK